MDEDIEEHSASTLDNVLNHTANNEATMCVSLEGADGEVLTMSIYDVSDKDPNSLVGVDGTDQDEEDDDDCETPRVNMGRRNLDLPGLDEAALQELIKKLSTDHTFEKRRRQDSS